MRARIELSNNNTMNASFKVDFVNILFSFSFSPDLIILLTCNTVHSWNNTIVYACSTNLKSTFSTIGIIHTVPILE